MRYPLLPPEQRPLNITCIAFDRQGNTWVGTDGKGVFRIAPQRIKFGRAMPGQALPWQPRSWFTRGFAQWDAHRVLVGFYQGGLALFDERTGALGPAPLDARVFGGATDHGGPVQDAEGRIWLREGPVIRCVDPRTGQVVHRYTARCGDRMVPMADGSLVRMSTCHAPELLLPGPGEVRFRTLPITALNDKIAEQRNMPRSLFQDPAGRYWMSSDVMPIRLWNDSAELRSPFDAAVDPQQVVRLLDLRTDANAIWACTNDGLYRIDPTGLHIIRQYTVRDGLPDQYLYGMEPAGDGTWWISTNNGLSLFDPRTNTFRNHATADGLQSKEFNSNAFFRSASGRLYFGGVNGFNHFLPQAVKVDDDAALVHVVALRSGNDTLDLSRSGAALELPYPRNALRIELAVLEFTAPERNTYKWRMVGYRDAWITANASDAIELNNVPHGTFRLEVIGINGDGTEGPVRAVLGIDVVRPLWANPWSMVLLTVFVIGTVAWLWMQAYRKRMRTRLLLAQAEMKELRMRTRLAKDIHDDVGSGLARMAALSHSPKRTSDAEERFDKVGAISTELLDNLRGVVWMNDPRNDTLDKLLLRIRAFANDLFETEGVDLVFDLPEPLPTRTISGSARRSLYLIAREALHNARKYSKATRITVQWQDDAEGFQLAVADNGIGIASAVPKGSGHGTMNMQERAQEMGATFERGPGPEGGTVVRVFGRSSCLDG
jgi:signal transduction histidine kinase